MQTSARRCRDLGWVAVANVAMIRRSTAAKHHDDKVECVLAR